MLLGGKRSGLYLQLAFGAPMAIWGVVWIGVSEKRSRVLLDVVGHIDGSNFCK